MTVTWMFFYWKKCYWWYATHFCTHNLEWILFETCNSTITSSSIVCRCNVCWCICQTKCLSEEMSVGGNMLIVDIWVESRQRLKLKTNWKQKYWLVWCKIRWTVLQKLVTCGDSVCHWCEACSKWKGPRCKRFCPQLFMCPSTIISALCVYTSMARIRWETQHFLKKGNPIQWISSVFIVLW